MVRGVRVGMGALPGVGVTGRTVATSNEGLTDRQADGYAIHIVTAYAAVVGIQGGAGQGVIMTDTTGTAVITSYSIHYTKLYEVAAINVRNIDVAPHEILLTIINRNPELIAGFRGDGSMDQTVIV